VNLLDVFYNLFSLNKYYTFDGVSTKDNGVTTINIRAVDISGNRPREPAPSKPEVFNISNNLYTYYDAQAICKSYGARLATYDDMEEAYNNGAEWCNYGWSANQMAYFPTQKSTWNKLQQDMNNKSDGSGGDGTCKKKVNNSCGRPGINGGYFANPYLKFGVNCFGMKPKPSQWETNLMNSKKQNIVPKTPQEIEMDQKVQFWKENANKLLLINSYNGNNWSRF
jgi:hypothetical protein